MVRRGVRPGCCILPQSGLASLATGRAPEEGVDGPIEGLLVAAAEAVDGVQPAHQAAVGHWPGGRRRDQAEELVGAHPEELGEADDDLAWRQSSPRS